ncbi:unnamed protein product, partial [Medioppia subpectinata]
KVVLITGSSSGIGAATAALFASAGAQVVVTGRNVENIAEVAKDCTDRSPKGLKALEVVADVCQEEDCRRLIDTTIEAFGKLDILVNNVGAARPANVYDDQYLDSYRWNLQTNLDSVVYLTHFAVKYLEKTRGAIINISSVKSAQTSPQMSGYSMAKVAVDMFTRSVAVELADKGIRVNSIICGAVKTNGLIHSGLTQEQSDAVFATLGSATPHGKPAKPSEIANAVMYLCSDEAQYVRGSNFVMDGGWLAANTCYNPA